MGGPIVRTGTTPKFWQNWESVFGSKKSGTRGSKPATAKSPKAAKKAVDERAREEGRRQKEVIVADRFPSGNRSCAAGREMAVETTKVTSGARKPCSPARLLAVAAVFLSFTVDSFARYPVPGPNESHYLCKAKHYWNPEWCRGDLFLASSNAHLVFYQTFGLLTRWFSLETTAIIGRLAGLLILAAGWTALVGVLVPGRWPALWAAWIFLGTVGHRQLER